MRIGKITPKEIRLKGTDGFTEESSEKDVWSMRLVGKHGVMSKPSPILKFKRRLDFSDIYGV